MIYLNECPVCGRKIEPGTAVVDSEGNCFCSSGCEAVWWEEE